MIDNQENKIYTRRVAPLEKMLFRSPYAIVAMVARIKGNITEELLKDAVIKVQKRHTLLQVRIIDDDKNIPRFTTEGVKDIPIKIITRENADQWMDVYHSECKVPFDFNVRPAIRFILIRSPELSDLVIFCHHVICDGLSLAYLARDLMTYLGDPNKKIEILSNPLPIDRCNLPKDVKVNPIVKFVIEKRINKKFSKEKVFFGQKDYESLNKAYWDNFTHKMLSIELSEGQTSTLVNNCRKEGVTVNSALITAILGAQTIVQENKKIDTNFACAGNLRNQLKEPIGERMGFYAGTLRMNYKYDKKSSFWENTRKLHKKLKPSFTNKKLFKDPLNWCYLEPGLLESMTFKMVGKLAPKSSKLYIYSKKDDVITSLLKQDKMESFDNIVMGTAVTNLTRMDFPRNYGNLELDRLIMNPGGAFPLALVNVVLGAVTCSGKLSILLEYTEDSVDSETMKIIKDKTIDLLLN